MSGDQMSDVEAEVRRRAYRALAQRFHGEQPWPGHGQDPSECRACEESLDTLIPAVIGSLVEQASRAHDPSDASKAWAIVSALRGDREELQAELRQQAAAHRPFVYLAEWLADLDQQLEARRVVTLQDIVDRAKELVGSTPVRSYPYVSVDPALCWGTPTVNHTRRDVDVVGGMVRADGVDVACDEYNLTRGDVLTACWYLGVYGSQSWRRRWRQWADESFKAIARGDFDSVADPPREADTPPSDPDHKIDTLA